MSGTGDFLPCPRLSSACGTLVSSLTHFTQSILSSGKTQSKSMPLSRNLDSFSTYKEREVNIDYAAVISLKEVSVLPPPFCIPD